MQIYVINSSLGAPPTTLLAAYYKAQSTVSAQEAGWRGCGLMTFEHFIVHGTKCQIREG